MPQASSLIRSSVDWSRFVVDEFVNALTHGLGLVLSVCGAIVMVASMLSHADAWRVAGCSIYLASLVGVYAMSTLSHTFTSTASLRSLFRRLDQGFIYLLIVATYTPFSLAYLRTWPWWILLGVMWAIALWGFAAKVLFAHRVDAVRVWPCVVLGWLPAIAAPSLVQLMPVAVLWWMLAGGVLYSLGTLFLIYDERVRFFHAVWHLLVIAASACHFVAILAFIAAAS
jgi:hemolysin III